MEMLRGTPVVRGLRKFRINWKQIYVTLQGLLPALGRCGDLIHIRMAYSANINDKPHTRPAWSRGDLIQMVRRVQENGAADLWSFKLRDATGVRQDYEAIRIGWLDVPRQPTLRGEWRFDIWGSSPDSDASR